MSALRTEAFATVHGQEAVVVDAARRRKLDTRAGVNFTLLAAHQMLGAPCRAPSLALLSLEKMRALADELLQANPSDGTGHVQRGVVALREGRFSNAGSRPASTSCCGLARRYGLEAELDGMSA